ncbi:ankyrin repeat-containing domain protein [Mycena polygramma]|nr:ankyrin repeat-containing domain protein [Mycena polygramma]
MADIVGLIASILQLVDTVVKTRDYIEDFRNAPHDQQKLLKEIKSLNPLLGVLDPLIRGGRAGLLKNLETQLQQVEKVLSRLTKKLDRQGIEKFRGRLTWSLWGNKDVEQGLQTIERSSPSPAAQGADFHEVLRARSSFSTTAVRRLRLKQSCCLLQLELVRSLESSSMAQKGHHEQTVSLLADATEEQQINHHCRKVGKQQEHFHTHLSTTVRNAGKQQEHLHDRTLSRLENVAEKQDTHYNSTIFLKNPMRTYLESTRSLQFGDSQDQHQRAVDRDQLIKWYSPLNMLPRHAAIYKNWELGTGIWLLEHRLFREWKSGTGKVLWCQGMPGTGKTVLASLITNTLRVEAESQDIGVGVIYLEHRETDVPTPSSLLAALWRQLVFRKSISPALEHLFSMHYEPETRPTMEEDDAILRSIIVEYSQVFILVDGLDEYPQEPRDILLGYLGALGPSVNLLLTSRPHIIISHVISSYETVEIRATEHDIGVYLDSKIPRSKRLSNHIKASLDLQQNLKPTVVTRSDGMFLLAKLHFDSLTKTCTVKDARIALENMADNLDRAYGAVVDRINQQDPGDKRLAWRTLSWITHAKRPLRRSELIEALAIEPGAMELDPENLPKMEIVLSVCAGLVVIDEEDDKIHLMHYTTELFLCLPGVQAEAFPWAQSEITLTCITYLSVGFEAMADKLQQAVFLFTHNPFLHYAVDYCLIHARGDPEVQIKTSILSFLSHCSVWRRLWMWKHGDRTLTPDRLWIAAVFQLEAIYKHISNEAGERDGFGTLLHQAAISNTPDLLRIFLENGFDLQANEREYGSLALREASRRGLIDIVSLLIDHKVDIDKQGHAMAALNGHPQSIYCLLEGVNSDPCCCTALSAASEEGQEEVVRLLIEHGADVNADGGQALRAASKEGKTAVVRLLIEADDKVDVDRRGHNSTTLQTSAFNVHTPSIHGLLEGGISKARPYDTALCAALEAGHEEVVRLLIEHGADVNADGGQALRAASKEGKTAVVGMLIEAGADVDANGSGALWTGSVSGNADVVKLLIAAGADIHANNGQALCAASKNGHIQVVTLLIAAGADVNANSGQALEAASRNGNVEIVKLLIDAGADAGAKQALEVASTAKVVKLLIERGHTKGGRVLWTAGDAALIESGTGIDASGGGRSGNAEEVMKLCNADLEPSERGNAKIVKLLVENIKNSGHRWSAAPSNESMAFVKLLIAADADVAAKSGKALSAASERGYGTEIIKLLIEAGAGVDANGGRALTVASENGNAEVVKLLIDAGADVIAHGAWALSAASRNGNVEVVKLLIESRAVVNVWHGEALIAASRNGNAEIIKLLVQAGANRGQALTAASRNCHTEVVKLLIEARADIDADDRKALCAAASRKGNAEIVKLLIEAGAATNEQLDQALWEVSSRGYDEVAKLLIEAGADINAKGGDVLRAASRKGRTEVVKLLIEAGAHVNADDFWGRSALYYTSRYENTDVVKLLIRAGVEVNANGSYALRAASEKGNREVVDLLIEAGADVNAANGEPLRTASRYGRSEIVELLIAAGAKIIGVE